MKVLPYLPLLGMLMLWFACSKSQTQQAEIIWQWNENFSFAFERQLDYDTFLDYIFEQNLSCLDEYLTDPDPCHCNEDIGDIEQACETFTDTAVIADTRLVGELFNETFNYFEVVVHPYEGNYYYFIRDRPDDCYHIALTMACCFQWLDMDFNYTGTYPNPYRSAKPILIANTIQSGCLIVYRVPEFLEIHRQNGGRVEYNFPLRYGHDFDLCD